jgi:uncharacterized OB-fold protein
MSDQPDPRPRVRTANGAACVVGVRCSTCGYTSGLPRRRCPDCHGAVAEAEFGPAGRVWSATVVRIPVPGRTPPWALAYVDLDGGARVLAHVRQAGEGPVEVGTAVRVIGIGADGDLEVEELA